MACKNNYIMKYYNVVALITNFDNTDLCGIMLCFVNRLVKSSTNSDTCAQTRSTDGNHGDYQLL